MNHLEYHHDHTHVADLPFERLFDAYEIHSPEIFALDNLSRDEAFTGNIFDEKK